MSLNGTLSLIVGAHAPMSGDVSMVHLRWQCVRWRYEPMATFGSVVAILGKRTQRIIHWSTHTFDESFQKVALVDGGTQAADTPQVLR